MTKKLNGMAKWIIVALAVGGLVFNSGILYNDVAHLKKDITEIKKEVNGITNFLMGGGLAKADETDTPTDDR